MATKTANRASAGVTPKALRVGVVSDVATYSLDQSISNGDVIQLMKVPVNARIVDMYLVWAGGGQGSYVVGDGVSTNRYITAQTASATAQVRMNGLAVPYTYSTDDSIDLVYSSSTQPAAGAIYLVATIEYPGPNP